MSSPAKTMVTNFDELVAASDVLCAGAEGRELRRNALSLRPYYSERT